MRIRCDLNEDPYPWSGSNIEVIINIEQVNILFKWHGQNVYVQMYSQFESS